MDNCKPGTHDNYSNECNHKIHRNPTNLGKGTSHMKVAVNVHGSLCKVFVCLFVCLFSPILTKVEPVAVI